MARKAFTLIELLIVVAIIAILAAIAIPNFLEAQTRSKVSRVKNDLRTLKVGLESYRVDNNNYPWHIPGLVDSEGPELGRITTPIAYLTSLPTDPFRLGVEWNGQNLPGWYDYTRFIQYETAPGDLYTKFWNCSGAEFRQDPSYYGYMAFSPGPDKEDVRGYVFEDTFKFVEQTYDPTNGTISGGDIYGIGGFPNPQ